MILMTYNAKEDGDPEKTVVAGVTFRSGIPIELPPHKEWIGHKYAANGNPWFKVVEFDPADFTTRIEPMTEIDPETRPPGAQTASEPGKE